VLECGNILIVDGMCFRDILVTKWVMELKFVSGIMLGVGISL